MQLTMYAAAQLPRDHFFFACLDLTRGGEALLSPNKTDNSSQTLNGKQSKKKKEKTTNFNLQLYVCGYFKMCTVCYQPASVCQFAITYQGLSYSIVVSRLSTHRTMQGATAPRKSPAFGIAK